MQSSGKKIFINTFLYSLMACLAVISCLAIGQESSSLEPSFDAQTGLLTLPYVSVKGTEDAYSLQLSLVESSPDIVFELTEGLPVEKQEIFGYPKFDLASLELEIPMLDVGSINYGVFLSLSGLSEPLRFSFTNAVAKTPQNCTTTDKDPLDEDSSLSRLRVVENMVVDDDCNSVLLRGVALQGPRFMQLAYEIDASERHFYTEEDFRVLSEEWNVNFVRVVIWPELWINFPDYLDVYVDDLVAWGNQYGIYVLLGYHSHGNAGTGEFEETSWANDGFWQGSPYNPDKGHTISAMEQMVSRYMNKPWVIYSPFDEPSLITWDEWRPHAEELTDVIQAIDPRALTVIPGVSFAHDVTGILGNPVNRENVIYDVHVYPYSYVPSLGQPFNSDLWMDTVRDVAEVYPIIIGEWGYGPNTPIEGSRDEFAVPLLNLAKHLNIGWAAWIFHHLAPPALITSFETYETTEFGQLVKDTLTDR